MPSEFFKSFLNYLRQNIDFFGLLCAFFALHTSLFVIFFPYSLFLPNISKLKAFDTVLDTLYTPAITGVYILKKYGQITYWGKKKY